MVDIKSIPNKINASFQWPRPVQDKCASAILITGAARSGTTLVGKIIHSFQNVEFQFEPPTLFSLFSLIYSLQTPHWKQLYESYLYHEILLGSLSGRSINTNKMDDSSIYAVKESEEVENRLTNSLSMQKAYEISESKSIALKLPDIMPFVPELMTIYPKTRLVVTIRRAVATLNSLLKKGWFADKTLREGLSYWPAKICNGMRVPFWVARKDEESWIRMDEINKAAYYYICSYETLKRLPKLIFIRYEELLEFPAKTVLNLASLLQETPASKTDELIASIKQTKGERDLNILKKVEKPLREKLLSLEGSLYGT